MRFSIIIPAHNSAKFIRKALDSIEQQSFKDYEVIVVCDSCTDNTAEIARSYSNVVVREVDNRSTGLSRNKGLDTAIGKWILFLDSDDWFLHEYVLEQLDNKLKGLDADILSFSIIWKGIGYTESCSAMGNLYPHVTNKCWKKSFIDEHRLRFPSKYVAEDAQFHTLAMSANPKIAIWDMPMYYYNYLREGSKSTELGRSVIKTKAYWSTH